MDKLLWIGVITAALSVSGMPARSGATASVPGDAPSVPVGASPTDLEPFDKHRGARDTLRRGGSDNVAGPSDARIGHARPGNPGMAPGPLPRLSRHPVATYADTETHADVFRVAIRTGANFHDQCGHAAWPVEQRRPSL